MKTKAIVLAAIAGLAAGPLFASTMAEDANGDGAWSYEELVVAYPELTQESFLSIDVDADGVVSADEYTAAQASGLLPS